MRSVHVRNIIKLSLPLLTSTPTRQIDSKWANVPVCSFSLANKSNPEHEESYFLRLVVEDVNSEVEVPCGLSWAKRTPITIQEDSQNLHPAVYSILRLRIPEGTFNFKTKGIVDKPRAKIIVSTCTSQGVFQASSEYFNVLPKRRNVVESSGSSSNSDDGDVMPLNWHSSEVKPLPVENHVDDYTFDFENSLVPATMFNVDDYALLAQGNAEVVGNFRALNFYRTSDRRLKTDISSLSDRDCLRTLLCIEGVEYRFNSQSNYPTDQKFIGYIAQQVQQFIPQAVTEANGILHVDYTSLLPYVTEALKQMHHDVRQVESQVDQLKLFFEVMRERFERQINDSQFMSGKDDVIEYPSRKKKRSICFIAAATVAVLIISIISVIVIYDNSVHVNPQPSSPNNAQPAQPLTHVLPTPQPYDYQRDILIELYNATAGPIWFSQGHWLSDEPVCHWAGVACDGYGGIIGIELISNGLSGTLPGVLGRLNSLTTLDLRKNQLSGTIPTQFQNLTRLSFINLSSNQLEGSISFLNSNWTELVSIFLDDNQFSGTIPEVLSSLPSLRWVQLPQNQLEGAVPNFVQPLKFIDLSYNQLEGKLLLDVSNMPRLMHFNLGNNQLRGALPNFTSNEKLKYLNLANNHLVETNSFGIPNSLKTCLLKGNDFLCPIGNFLAQNCSATCVEN